MVDPTKKMNQRIKNAGEPNKNDSEMVVVNPTRAMMHNSPPVMLQHKLGGVKVVHQRCTKIHGVLTKMNTWRAWGYHHLFLTPMFCQRKDQICSQISAPEMMPLAALFASQDFSC